MTKERTCSWKPILAAIVVLAVAAGLATLAVKYPHYSGVARLYEQVRGIANEAAAAAYVFDKYGDSCEVVGSEAVREDHEGGLSGLFSAPYLAYATDYAVRAGGNEFTVRASYSNKGLRDDPLGKIAATNFCDDRQFDEITQAVASYTAHELGLPEPIASSRTSEGDYRFTSEPLRDGNAADFVGMTYSLTLVFAEGAGTGDVTNEAAESLMSTKPNDGRLSAYGIGELFLYEVREGFDPSELELKYPTSPVFGHGASPGQADRLSRLDYFEWDYEEVADGGTGSRFSKKVVSERYAWTRVALPDVRVENARNIQLALPPDCEFVTGVYKQPGLVELPAAARTRSSVAHADKAEGDNGHAGAVADERMAARADEAESDKGYFYSYEPLEGCPGAGAAMLGDQAYLFVPSALWDELSADYGDISTVSCAEAREGEGASTGGVGFESWSLGRKGSDVDYVVAPIDVPRGGTFALAGKPR